MSSIHKFYFSVCIKCHLFHLYWIIHWLLSPKINWLFLILYFYILYNIIIWLSLFFFSAIYFRNLHDFLLFPPELRFTLESWLWKLFFLLTVMHLLDSVISFHEILFSYYSVPLSIVVFINQAICSCVSLFLTVLVIFEFVY